MDSLKRKAWGNSSIFCPVALHDLNVLWPGNQDFACRYRERLYYLSTTEAKDKFTTNPNLYLACNHPLRVCIYFQVLYLVFLYCYFYINTTVRYVGCLQFFCAMHVHIIISNSGGLVWYVQYSH